MDSFSGLALVWLVSAVIAAAFGYCCGRANDALTLGVLLGPIGLLLVILWMPRVHNSIEEYVPDLCGIDADRPDRKATVSETPLRRAA
jgi:hypothetical protein